MNFYSSMKEILDNSSNEKTKRFREASSSSLFAKALVPLNPHRWGPCVAGSVSASDIQKLVTS